MAHTPWTGLQAIKLYLQSGQFTSTLKTSEDVSSIDLLSRGVTYDGTNTPWCGETDDKLYLTSGQFTSTIKTSQGVAGIDVNINGISWDGVNTPWTGFSDDKLYLTSGQFSSTIKTSQDISGVDTFPTGISYGRGDTPWAGFTDVKLYLTSGQFTSTLKTSESVSGVDTAPQDISWDGANTPWCGSTDVKLYLTSGQFTSTIKTSEDISGIDNIPLGICTNDVAARISTVHEETATNIVTFTQELRSNVFCPEITATPWCGSTDDKLYLTSGQFTSTLKTSEDVSGIQLDPSDISARGPDTPWCSTAGTDTLYMQSGRFTSTVKISQDVSGIENGVLGIATDEENTVYSGNVNNKLYLQSGQFTSTLKTSQAIGSIDITPSSVSTDGINTPWIGNEAFKLYLTSGQFTSTIKTSEYIGGVDGNPSGISFDGRHTPWIGASADKLYLTSGQFTSTIKTSESIGSIDTNPQGISTDSSCMRLGGPTIFNLATISTVTFSQVAAGINNIFSELLSNTITFTQIATAAQYPTYLTASNAVAFTQEAKIPDVFEAAATNTFTFTQIIVRAGTEYITATNEVAFISQADAELNGVSIISRSVLNTVVFTQTATKVVPFKIAIAASNLTFTQSILVIFPRTVIASSFFEFLQFINVNPKFLFAASNLAEVTFFPPQDSEIVEPVVAGFQQTIDLIQITGKSGESSRINFEQRANVVHIRAADGISKAATNTVTFVQNAQVTYGSDSIVTFAQTAVANVCKPCKSILTFQQTVALQADTTRTTTSTIEFEQSAFHSLTRAGVLCNSQGSIVPISVHFNDVQFSYPITSPTHTLTLRGPEFGNRERMQFQRINRETRGGTLIVFADPIWPKNDHLVMDFIGLSETETNQVRSFVKTTLGKQVTFRDWEGRNWVGIIVSPDNPVVRDGVLCMNTVTIELEGHAGFDSLTSSVITFSQSAVATKT